jgi:tRNA(Ile)-lysidine synthase
MENLLSTFQNALKKLQVSQKDRLLLAVSGGLDSVVLTTLSSMAALDFGIAHANFQLRGEESTRDEEFVRNLAIQLGKPFVSKKFDTARLAEKEKESVQLAARNLRYTWFKTLLGNKPGEYQYLLTAHHLEDNIETLLMHFFRGTGITGLTGIPEKNEKLIRPLLSVSKNSIRDFAVSNHLKWVEDSSNAKDDYTRNFFRNQLIPSAARVFPDLKHNLESNLQRFSEAAILYEQAILQHKKKLLKANGAEFHIPILLLKKSKPVRTILYEILKDFHFTPAQTDEVIRLMDGSNGKYISSPSNRVIKNRGWLIIAPLEHAAVSHIIIDENKADIEFPDGILRIKKIARPDFDSGFGDLNTAFLDEDKIRFPLILRKWKAGDYFYPLGMKKKKKLARFFIDQKLSKTAKEKIWVLVMDSQIIWTVGQRIDNRFCIQPSTTRILQIRNGDV